MMPLYYVGLDLGQAADYSALCLLLEEALWCRPEVDFHGWGAIVPPELEDAGWVSLARLSPRSARQVAQINFELGRPHNPPLPQAPRASRWKFPAVHTWSDTEETITNYYGRDLKPHARTTATADRAHGSSARDAQAFDATEEQYSRTGAPGAHRPGRRRRPQQRADRPPARDEPADGALVAEGVLRCPRASDRHRGGDLREGVARVRRGGAR
jgi:hypothetical protein